jgi:hypothetical protein
MARGTNRKVSMQDVFDSIYDAGAQTIQTAQSYLYTNRIASSAAAGTSAQVKATAGILHGIVINKTTTGSLSLYDAAAVSAAASIMWQLPASLAVGSYFWDAEFNNGLNIMATSAWDYTVLYR